MADPFHNHSTGLTSPAINHYTITPSDTVDLPQRPRAIYVNAEGNAVLQDEHGTNVTYAVTAGQVLTFRATRVLATGTTATLVAWW
jgi:hypothetical protein